MKKNNRFLAISLIIPFFSSCNFQGLTDLDAVSSKSTLQLPLGSHPQNGSEQNASNENGETNTLNFLTTTYAIADRLSIPVESIDKASVLLTTENNSRLSMPDGESVSSLTSSSVLALQQVILAGCIATVEENRGLRLSGNSLSTFNVNQSNPTLAMTEQNWQNYEKDLVQRFHGILSPSSSEIQPLRNLRLTMTSQNFHASAIAEAMCFASAMGSDIWLR